MILLLFLLDANVNGVLFGVCVALTNNDSDMGSEMYSAIEDTSTGLITMTTSTWDSNQGCDGVADNEDTQVVPNKFSATNVQPNTDGQYWWGSLSDSTELKIPTTGMNSAVQK